MLFNSYIFLFAFLPVVTLAYLVALRFGMRAGSIALLAAASYLFYLTGETVYPWLLAISIALNFAAGRLIANAQGPARRRLVALAIAANLAALGYFKYSNFFLDQLVLLGLEQPGAWKVVLPVGISFFTFTQIAFLVDVYQRKSDERQFVPYALFVSYFPHLIAGPILHHGEMLPQFRNARTGRVAENLFAGMAMLTIGLAKKVLLADPCGNVASQVFNMADGGHPSFFVAWIGAIAYALQIYFDFSGYSDMAIGASRMLGIELPINFNSPYKSDSILTFWRRWHITLSRFLRDYLYIPLGGNRKGVARRYINLFLTMLLGGIWHGAGWGFVIWGAMHGLAQSMAHGLNDLRARWPIPRLPRPLGWLLTMVFVIVAWVPFRAPGMHVIGGMWGGMAGMTGFAAPDIGKLGFLTRWLGSQPVGFGSNELAVIAVAVAVALWAPNSQELLGRFRIGLDSPKYDARGRPPRWAITMHWGWVLVLAVLLGITLRSIGGYSEFIYFQF